MKYTSQTLYILVVMCSFVQYAFSQSTCEQAVPTTKRGLVKIAEERVFESKVGGALLWDSGDTFYSCNMQTIYKSIDGARSFQQVYVSTGEELNKSLRCWVNFGSDTVLAVGNKGYSIRTTDGGKTWGKYVVPTTTSMFLLEKNSRIVTTPDVVKKLMYSSKDRGETWDSIPLPEEMLASISGYCILNDSSFIVVSAWQNDRIAFRTIDNGKVWKQIGSCGAFEFHILQNGVILSQNRDYYAPRIGFPRDDRLIGFIHRSTDYGDTWENVLLDSTLPLDGLKGFASRTNGTVVVAGPQKIHLSNDYGKTWVRDTALSFEGAIWGLAPVFLSDTTFISFCYTDISGVHLGVFNVKQQTTSISDEYKERSVNIYDAEEVTLYDRLGRKQYSFVQPNKDINQIIEECGLIGCVFVVARNKNGTFTYEQRFR